MALRGVSLIGIGVMAGLAWSLSENRRAVPWRLAGWALALQFALGLLVLRTPAGEPFFEAVRGAFDLLTAASEAGAAFLFGDLTRVILLPEATTIPASGPPEERAPLVISAVIAFRVLPVIVFVSAIAAMLQHFGIVQAVVRGMAWLMRRSLKTSGPETFGAALLVFLGIESLSALRGYLAEMTRSELFTLMTAFLATIAASVMVTYAAFGAEPGHLLAASLMSAPAAIAMAKIMIPETSAAAAARAPVRMPAESHNIFDAAARGSGLGLQMALNVGALLLVFVGLIHLADRFTEALAGAELTAIAGWFFRPFAFVMGVPPGDVATLGELLATKSVFNEFLAYEQMQGVIREGGLTPRGTMVATYALCGFANPGSLGILLGAFAALLPERRAEVAELSLRAFAAGTLACFSTACVAGVLG